MLFKVVWTLIMLGGKYHQENAKNGISEPLDFKIFYCRRLLDLLYTKWR